MAGPAVGDPAPSFELPDHDGKLRRLEDLLDGPLVLFFYPGDFTWICTQEVCTFRDAFDDFRDLEATVVGISDDPPGKHAAFRREYDLPFALLSDEEGEAIEAYGAKGLFKTKRLTFLISEDGRIVDRIRSLRAGPHVDEALARLPRS